MVVFENPLVLVGLLTFPIYQSIEEARNKKGTNYGSFAVYIQSTFISCIGNKVRPVECQIF